MLEVTGVGMQEAYGQGSEWSAEDWLGLARPGQNESSLMVEIRLTG